MSLKNPELSIERVAEATITEGLILKQGTAGLQVLPAAAATDKLIGVSEHDAATGTGARMQVGGRAKLKAGGTIAAGDLLTSNASGQAITAAPATGVNNRIIGYALEAAVSGDFFSGMIFPSEKQGA
jgi:hypothetical protein